MNEANQEKLGTLFEELVPASGKSDCLAGEIVRATSRIGYRWYNDGDQIGIGYGKETCNAAARFLTHRTNKEIAAIIAGMDGLLNEKNYEVLMDKLIASVLKYIDNNPGLRGIETPDMFDYRDDDEDVDDSCDDDEDYEIYCGCECDD